MYQNDDTITTGSQETRRGITADSPESVACYIRRSQESNRSGDASKFVISEQIGLFQWARMRGKLRSSIEELIFGTTLVFQAEGFEHVVYHDQRFALAVKLTRQGTFGFFGDVLEYLDRLDYCNSLFGDEITVDGVLQREGDRFQIVTSQPWITEDHDAVPPTLDEIEVYFEALKFQMFWPGPENPAFYRQDPRSRGARRTRG
jgi:hypothetical protein